MFRTIPRLALPVLKRSFATSSVVARPFAVAARFQQVPQFTQKWNARSYSAEAGLTRETISARILEVLTSFEKVDPAKVRGLVLAGGRPMNYYSGLGILVGLIRYPRGCKLIIAPLCSQVSATAAFTKDLGLDSLDAVEVVMAIEGNGT